ncbi:uncharacterized protein LOC110025237 [Phalaenopsis equestris]|uniref:uncharacterized protein LOC110025237 n=1 Tax=Phalaenopsis equestris TaxID=78828 RepID=UPI0009E3AFA3|nr:uncharacterized protein LOC110025237 [Phalaenopsis equestris]
MELSLSIFLLYFSFSSFLFRLSAQTESSAPPGTIQRATKQQLLVAIPPGEATALPPFLISPAGKYVAYFLRTPTAPDAGGFGNDFCFIQVQDTGAGESVWESECAPVSTSNTCSLVFSDDGLEIFDGSNSAWDSDAQSSSGDPLQSLELVDVGDMRIRDNEGELAWKASDDPRSNQRCGERGSPGLGPTMPPFAEPMGGSSKMPFGQQAADGQGQGGGGSDGFGVGGQMGASSAGGRYEGGNVGIWVHGGWLMLIFVMIF